ncbi:MAG: hypothetical protein OFPI_36960 [Osedax symbiont Rs2]|nr:MAG: hypothetical protein OFPI_36960 [Osedax symbiont Rs2]
MIPKNASFLVTNSYWLPTKTFQSIRGAKVAVINVANFRDIIEVLAQ